MKIKKMAAVALGCALLSGSNALAITYVDNNPADVWINVLNPSYNGQFDLTGYGYNPISQQINSAIAVFTLWDLPVLGGSEGYQISVEGPTLFSGGSFSATINLGTAITGTLLGNLDADGILNYTVSRTSGEFWLLNANLTAEAGDRGVPDGGATTFALLGMGLLGVFGIRHKLA